MIKRNKSILDIFLCLFIGALVLSGAARLISQDRSGYDLPDNPLKGSDIFFKKGCIECHTVWGIGKSFGPDLTQIGRQKDFFGLTGSLWGHSPKMIDVMEERGVERPVFSAEEIESLLAYIYYLGIIDELGEYLEGEKVFTEKGCIQCHSLGGDP